MGEAHISTEHTQAGQEARLPAPHVRPRRPGDHQVASPQGTQAAVGLIWRVRHRRSFQAFRGARRGRSGPLSITWVPDDLDVPPRVAFAIGRQVGPAVVRNRLRRRLRAILRDVATDLSPGTYLVGTRPEAAHLSFPDLRAALMHSLQDLSRPRTGRRS
jgi:ribonuclease P protein component